MRLTCRPARNRTSCAREHRLALFHEGAAALGIVLALEALLDHGGAFREIALAFVLDHLADREFRGGDGERRVFADRLGVVLDIGVKLGCWHDAVDKAHDARLLGVELARRVENLLRKGDSDDIDELLETVERIAEAELGGRDGEARIVRANAQVAAQREADPAADAIAADHSDGRFRKIVDRRIGALDRLIVAHDRFFIGALVLEPRNIGAGHEGLVAGAGQHHDPHVLVAVELLENPRGCLPHFERDRVAAFGVVEDHVTDMPVLAREHLVGLGNSVHLAVPYAFEATAVLRDRRCPQIAFAWRSAAISLALNPNSSSTASVCSPRPGGGATSRLGVRDNETGWPTSVKPFAPSVATPCAMATCLTCGS